MNPATHANPCSASTSELRNSTKATSPGVGGRVSPGNPRGVESGVLTTPMSQVARSSATATATLPASQPRSTGQGARFQAASVLRVSRTPWTRTRSFARMLDQHRQRATRR